MEHFLSAKDLEQFLKLCKKEGKRMLDACPLLSEIEALAFEARSNQMSPTLALSWDKGFHVLILLGQKLSVPNGLYFIWY